MLPKTLLHLAWRYLLRHPWQSVLMVLGITLGVAVAVAVDLANASASRAFDLSTEAVAGRATHFIAGGPEGLDETVYTRMRRSGLPVDMAPVVTEYVSSPQLGENLLQLLGVDPFTEAPFRDYLGTGPDGSSFPLNDLVSFLTRPGAVLISTGLAERYGLKIGDALTLEIGGHQEQAFIAGLVHPTDSLSQRALESLVLADISSAQEFTGRIGKLDRIDLILPEKELPALQKQLEPFLLPGLRLLPVEARTGALAQMTSAFRVNLTALSLLALIVGLFLIYNTMTFSVVQRRSLFGTLRCLGVTRQEVFLLVLGEALIIGALGAVLGLGLGVLMGQGAVRLVTRTINDLFFALTVQGVQVPSSSLVKGAVLGILATVLSAAPPAWEAASVPPRAALIRSGLERKARTAVFVAAGAGLGLFVIGLVILLVPTRNLTVSFSGTFAAVLGFALLAPLITLLLAIGVIPLTGKLWGALGRLAPRDVINTLSRTSVAVAALMVAISVTIGVSLMVSSFRHTVVVWLGEILTGDIYISAPTLIATQASAPVDERVLKTLETWPGVEQVLTLRSVEVDSPDGPVHIAASGNPMVGAERLYLSRDLPEDELVRRMQTGAVVVSEPFANRHNLPQNGGTVRLYTDNGLQQFAVVGIYYDYASTEGTVLMSLDVYRQFWKDTAITSIALRLEPGVNPDTVSNTLREALNPLQRLVIRPNQTLRQEVLVVFDRTFAITGALQLLATVVAFIGVLSALLSLELERQRELGILRSIGLTARQLWGMVMLETGLLGTVAGLLSMPTGYILSLILVYIINRRSFGWTLQMQVTADPFLQALAVAIGAALLAGVYPAFRMSRMITSEAMRYE